MNLKTTNQLLSVEHEKRVFVGSWVTPKGGAVTVTDKASGEPIFESGLANAADVAASAEAARDAQAAWARRPATSRADVLRKFAQLLETHAAEVSRWIVRESGSIPPKGDFEIGLTIREALEVASLAGAPVGHILSTTGDKRSFAQRVPIGVVGVITPWNSPFILAARAMLPALVLGNAVILKPDVQTPVSGGHLIARLFEEAGLPAGVLHVLPGAADTGEALVRHPAVGMISFTGSTAVGRRVGEIAGGMLKRVALELGGNNALIVMADADIERAVSAAAFGSFFHQGQICFTAGRHLVHESIAAEYTKQLATRAAALAVGDPNKAQVHLGPMINARQVQRAQKILDDSVALGAKPQGPISVDGLYFKPVVLSGVTPDMPAFNEEIFAPVAPVTVFRTEEEAIALANRSEYGLVASIFTRNEGTGLRMARQMRTGIVHINDQTVNHEVFGPIGGMGASGNGARSGNLTSLDEYTQWQWVTVADEVPGYPF